MFLVLTPYIVLYSLGYRIDIQHFKVVATGGIYVKAIPQGATIAIDSNLKNTTGLFSPSAFFQNLLPGIHQIQITKDGYYDYQKNLPVQQNQVTKLEHVVLFKKDTVFTAIHNTVTSFYLTPDGKNILTATKETAGWQLQMIALSNPTPETSAAQTFLLPSQQTTISSVVWAQDSSRALVHLGSDYYVIQPFSSQPKATKLVALAQSKEDFFNPKNANEIFFLKNKNLYSNLQSAALIKNVATYQVNGSTVTWLGLDGILYTATLGSFAPQAITTAAFAVNPINTYDILVDPKGIFLKENTTLFSLNPTSFEFKPLYSPTNTFAASGDGQKILFYNDHQILISYLATQNTDISLSPAGTKVHLYQSTDPIVSVQWLNNDYVIFQTNTNVEICEIDVRGNANAITLLPTSSLMLANNQTITNMAFDTQDQKLYLVANNTLYASEKLLP